MFYRNVLDHLSDSEIAAYAATYILELPEEDREKAKATLNSAIQNANRSR